MSLTQIVLAVNIGKMGIPDVNLQELNIKSSMILHSTSTIEITSYKDLEEKMKTQQKIFMNRELSWLKFNERVLEETENKEVPLCERLTFASIYQSNLDEFFMVRVGSLIDQMLLDKNMKENKTKMTPQEQIDAIIPQVQKLNRRKDIVYEEMMDSLKEHNIHLVNFQKISKKESEYLRAYFQAEIAPLISPTIIGKRQPFPFLKNKEIYAVAVLETKNGKEKLGIIPCGNETFDRLINIPGKDAYMLSEEMILHYVPRIFKGYHVKAKTLIRITRNADIDVQSEKNMREHIISIPGWMNARRFVDAKQYEAACRKLAETVIAETSVKQGERVLVIGTEEFMYPALLTGQEIEKMGCDVRSHSTTRSPIAVSTEEEYPLHCRYELRSLYDPDRKTFIYDLESYDRVIVMTDSALVSLKGLETLTYALRMKNENITVIRWC